MNIEIKTIKPKDADSLLCRNEGNRKISPMVVERFAEDMRRNKWSLNGETIKIYDADGELPVLLDGQHRLSACVKAKKAFTTAVAYVDSPSAFSTIDCGKNRSAGDIMTILGYPSGNALASALKLLMQVEANKLGDVNTGGGASNYSLKNHQLQREIEKRVPLLSDSVAFSTKMKAKLKTRPSAIAVAHYQLSHAHRIPKGTTSFIGASRDAQTCAEEFLTLLHTGENLKAGSPILAYRNFLIKWMQSEDNKLTNYYLLKGIYSTWNNVLSNKTISKCRILKSGPLPRIKKI